MFVCVCVLFIMGYDMTVTPSCSPIYRVVGGLFSAVSHREVLKEENAWNNGTPACAGKQKQRETRSSLQYGSREGCYVPLTLNYRFLEQSKAAWTLYV